MPAKVDLISSKAVHHLQSIFGVSRRCANVILRRQQELVSPEEHDILGTLKTLQKWGLDLEEVAKFPKILTRTHSTLDHQKHILEECGINVTLPTLAVYLKINRAFVFALIKHRVLPPDHDLVETLCHSVDITSADLIRSRLGGKSRADLSLFDVRTAVFRQLLCDRLACTDDTARVMVERYPRNRHKSLRLTQRVLNLLERQGFAAEKIVRNPYLLNTHPDQFESLLANCPTVASVEIGHIMQKVPRITYMPWHNTAEIVSCLQQHGFSEEVIVNGPEVFTLAADTVRKRLDLMSQIPELWAMRHNRNFLKMVYMFHRTLGRLSYMQSVNMRCLSVRLLSAYYPQFRRYLTTGEDRTGGSDIVTLLSQHLDIDGKRIRHQLRHHDYWKMIPVGTIAQTVEALLEAGYTKRQLGNALHLCLYPTGRVLAAAQAEERAWCEGGSEGVPREYFLQVVLYRIERENHFSGTAVFEFTGVDKRVGVRELGTGEFPASDAELVSHAAPSRADLCL